MTDDTWPAPPEPRRPGGLGRLFSSEIANPSAGVKRLLQRKPGLYHVSSVRYGQLRRALVAAEWRLAEATGSAIPGFEVGRALGLRMTSLRDPAVLDAELAQLDGPTALLWRQWETAAVADPLGFTTLLGALRARALGEGAPFACVLVADRVSTTPPSAGPDRYAAPPLPGDGERPEREPIREDRTTESEPGMRWTPG